MPDRYVRISLLGSLVGGETWSVNPAFIGNFSTQVPSQANLDTWSAAVAADVPSLVTQQLQNLMSQNAAVVGVRVTLFGPDGKTAAYSEKRLSSPFFGQGAQTAPATVAFAASLYTGIPGRQYRGRLFWPALRPTIDQTTGRYTGSALAATAAEFSSMLENLQNAGGGPFDPVLAVWSGVRKAGTVVTSVRAGDIYDSQRRRKESLAESYASAAYPPAA